MGARTTAIGRRTAVLSAIAVLIVAAVGILAIADRPATDTTSEVYTSSTGASGSFMYNYTFTLSVNYSGPWHLTYLGYNNLGTSNATEASGSHNGTGFYSKAVALSGSTYNGLTLCAQAQKLDTSNSTLVLRITGSNETSIPYGAVSYCGRVVP